MSNLLPATIHIPDFARYGSARTLSPKECGDEIYDGTPSDIIPPDSRLSFPDRTARKEGHQPTLRLSEEMASKHMKVFGYIGHIKNLIWP